LPPRLTIEQILIWADEHCRRTGDWPRPSSERIPGTDNTWNAVQIALNAGRRGLMGGLTLAILLERYRGRPHPQHRPRLTEGKILKWADAHYRQTGTWPTRKSGPILAAPGETWILVDGCLRAGTRGLRYGGSLAKLLAKRRGVRNTAALTRLTIRQILAWADAHHRRTGRWPSFCTKAPLPDAPGENWAAINASLRDGLRGLPGGETLAHLLVRYRNVRRTIYVPALTVPQILRYADAHARKTGHLPSCGSGPVDGVPGLTWNAIDIALTRGGRGLPPGFTLATLLERYRGLRHHGHLSRLTKRKILAWADAHFQRTGEWPHQNSTTEIPEAPDEKWPNINSALLEGFRGLPGGDSISRLLIRHGRRRAVNRKSHPP
jgi:hypothetical protein